MNDLGIGSGMAYEYVVAEKKSAALICKKICLILLYVLWAAGFLAAVFLAGFSSAGSSASFFL